MEILKLKGTLTKTNKQKNTLKKLKRMALFVTSKESKQSKCLSTGKWLNNT